MSCACLLHVPILRLHCNILQYTATHCNTLQHTATHCNTLQHAATHCNTLHHTATRCNTLQHTAANCNTPQHGLDYEDPFTKHPVFYAATKSSGLDTESQFVYFKKKRQKKITKTVEALSLSILRDFFRGGCVCVGL